MANSRRSKMDHKEKKWRREVYMNQRYAAHNDCSSNKPVDSAAKAFNRPAYGGFGGKNEDNI